MKDGDVLFVLIAIFLSLPLPAVEGRISFGQIGEYTSEELDWGLTDTNKTKTCILLTGFFEVVIPYENDYGSQGLAVITAPINASVSGFCDSPTDHNLQIITLSWDPQGHSELGFQHSLTFEFIRKSSSDSTDNVEFFDPYYELRKVHGSFWTNEYEFPDSWDKVKIYNVTTSEVIMSAPENLSYYCKSTRVVIFDDGVNTIGMSYVHAEAFHKELAFGDGKDFGMKSFCAEDGFKVIIMVVSYIILLSIIGLGIFFIVDRRSKGKGRYIYL